MAINYNKHNWAYGEEITPDKLNNVENGVKTNADAINEVNNNLQRFYFDGNKALLGITNDTTLNQLIDDKMLPQWSKLVLWINDETEIGREVQKALYTSYAVKLYGYLTVVRNGDVIKLYFEDYESTKIYVNSYSTINNLGWYREWTLK